MRIFFDLKSLKAGEVWPEGIQDNLDRCCALIAVIGRTWLTVTDNLDRRRIDDEDDWVRKEISTTFERGIPVIPILLDGAEMPGASDSRALPKCLQELPNRQALKLRMADYVPDLDRLADELAQYLPTEARRPAMRRGAHESDIKAPTGFLPIADTASLIARASADTYTLRATMIEEKNKGNSALAKELAHRVREREDREQEVDDRIALISRYNEAQAILEQGRAAEAETLLRKVLAAEERLQGVEHPSTLTTRHNLAVAILSQGRAAEGEELFRDLLPLREKINGSEHPYTLAVRQNLANGILVQGRAAEAEALLRDLLPLKEKVSGTDHHETHSVRRSLAEAALEQGAIDRARKALWPLPPDGGDADPRRKGQTALLDEAEGHLAHLAPDHYARRELAKYRATRGPDGKGGTTLWMLDT